MVFLNHATHQVLLNDKLLTVRAMKKQEYIDDGAIHIWFELSYAQYLTIPRSVLQSMPLEWQERFVRCLRELDNTIDWRPKSGRYWVQLKNDKGLLVHDSLMDYDRGRRRVNLNDNREESTQV